MSNQNNPEKGRKDIIARIVMDILAIVHSLNLDGFVVRFAKKCTNLNIGLMDLNRRNTNRT